MRADWQISAGYLSEFALPALFVLAVVVSAWVLRDTLRRGLHTYTVAAWTLFALVLPHVALPLYLAVRIFSARAEAPDGAATGTDQAAAAQSPPAQDEARPVAVEAAQSVADASPDDVQPFAPEQKPRWGLALALLYASLLLSGGALYFYSDYRSTDARLARAESAKIRNQYERAIREYRGALALAPDAHTRKLLGVELLKAERWEEALTELRAAESEGEPDEAIPFHMASALRALDRQDEAAADYQKFLHSRVCTQLPADARCEAAQKFLKNFNANQPHSGGG